MEHETELDPKICYTDTHGYTEVVMATAVLLGYELPPRIKDIKDQSLYKIDRQQRTGEHFVDVHIQRIGQVHVCQFVGEGQKLSKRECVAQLKLRYEIA